MFSSLHPLLLFLPFPQEWSTINRKSYFCWLFILHKVQLSGTAGTLQYLLLSGLISYYMKVVPKTSWAFETSHMFSLGKWRGMETMALRHITWVKLLGQSCWATHTFIKLLHHPFVTLTLYLSCYTWWCLWTKLLKKMVEQKN